MTSERLLELPRQYASDYRLFESLSTILVHWQKHSEAVAIQTIREQHASSEEAQFTSGLWAIAIHNNSVAFAKFVAANVASLGTCRTFFDFCHEAINPYSEDVALWLLTAFSSEQAPIASRQKFLKRHAPALLELSIVQDCGRLVALLATSARKHTPEEQLDTIFQQRIPEALRADASSALQAVYHTRRRLPKLAASRLISAQQLLSQLTRRVVSATLLAEVLQNDFATVTDPTGFSAFALAAGQTASAQCSALTAVCQTLARQRTIERRQLADVMLQKLFQQLTPTQSRRIFSTELLTDLVANCATETTQHCVYQMLQHAPAAFLADMPALCEKLLCQAAKAAPTTFLWLKRHVQLSPRATCLAAENAIRGCNADVLRVILTGPIQPEHWQRLFRLSLRHHYCRNIQQILYAVPDDVFDQLGAEFLKVPQEASRTYLSRTYLLLAPILFGLDLVDERRRAQQEAAESASVQLQSMVLQRHLTRRFEDIRTTQTTTIRRCLRQLDVPEDQWSLFFSNQPLQQLLCVAPDASPADFQKLCQALQLALPRENVLRTTREVRNRL